MHHIPLPFTDAFLFLSPRWGELSGFAQTVLLLLVALVPVALVVWLYRYELRLVSRVRATGLLLLRLAVLLLLAALVCLQPALARVTTEEVPGRVLVAVDRSGSTDLADPQRPAVDKLRLARALRLVGDLCTDEQLTGWIRQYEQGAALEGQLPAHDAVCRRVDALTRAEAARRVLAEEGARLLPALLKKHQVELVGFAQQTWDARPDHLDDLFPPPSREPSPPSAFTDLHRPLMWAQERMGAGQGKVLGVVLLTDGQHNTGPSPASQAQELGEQLVPIFPVALGARLPPRDVALVHVQAPPTVFKDTDVAIDVRFKVSGIDQPLDLELELRRPGDKKPLQTRTIRHDGSDRIYVESFSVRFDQAGVQTLTATVRPRGRNVPEARTDNNSRPVVLQVADDKARVLLIDGEARWEYHYLANALARDRTVRPTSVVFVQPRLGSIPEEALLKMGNPRLALPPEPEALAGYDCILLGDVSPEQLPLADRERLEKFVADGGGTLVLVAGKRFLPLGFTGLDDDPLSRLLPLEQPRAVKPEPGFAATLTAEGKRTPFLRLEPEPDANEKCWAELPRHYWGVIGRAKPGAVPLACYVGEDQAGMESAEREQALIVRQNYGFGRVLYVGLDSTWRWRYKVGDTYHHRFWGQVVRWAASDRPLVAGNEYVRFGTPELVYRPGQDVAVIVRLAEGVELGPDALAGARVLRPVPDAAEEAVALVPLSRREAQPRVLEGRLRDLPPGQYAVELAIPELADKLNGPAGPDGKPAKLRAALTVAAAEGEEMVELATNGPLLEDLASRSGGQVFAPENAADLLGRLEQRMATREVRVETRLWQWWGTLVLALALLTAEWASRKWAGLP
jgi:hypothetical protein